MSEVIGAGIGIGMLILLGFVYVLVMALSVVSCVFMALGIGGMMKSFGNGKPAQTLHIALSHVQKLKPFIAIA